ncbi:hypothetical protein SALBM217S_03830 [Streptomyces griseoloalbus]
MRTRTRGSAAMLRTYWLRPPNSDISQNVSPMRRLPTGAVRGEARHAAGGLQQGLERHPPQQRVPDAALEGL